MLKLKFGTQNALLVYFWERNLKNIAIFEMSTLEFVYLQNFANKQKCLNLEPQMPYLVVFGLEF